MAQKGSILMVLVVFTGIFLILAGGLAGLIHYQYRLGLTKMAQSQALQIAESGVNYYRWHLAHAPSDYQDGTGQTGPYLHNYTDQASQISGQFSLEIIPPLNGSTVVTIKSTGWVGSAAQKKKIVEVKYGLPSLARYSYLTNSDVWFGANKHLSGEAHSNGGIRMDGTNDSRLNSSKETYLCTPSHGCNNETKPGIWGSGTNNKLWNFPVTTIDFESITMDLAQMKNQAQSNGLYFSPQAKGYRLIFKSDSTFDLYKITNLESAVWQLNDDWTQWEQIAEEIKNENFLGNYPQPANGLIFVEDNLWVEGTVNGKITLVSAKFPDNPNTNTNIRINNNLTYLNRNGNHALGLIAQKNIIVPKYAPSDLYIDAVLLAQKGRVYRNYYSPQQIKNSIQVYGGIISNKTWTWTWVDGGGSVLDGYANTSSIYDTHLIYTPPPFFPTAGEYSFISWQEKNP